MHFGQLTWSHHPQTPILNSKLAKGNAASETNILYRTTYSLVNFADLSYYSLLGKNLEEVMRLKSNCGVDLLNAKRTNEEQSHRDNNLQGGVVSRDTMEQEQGLTR